MVLFAGTLTSPSSRRTRSSRILRAPQCGLVAFGVDNEAFELLRQLVGIPQTIVQGLEPVLLVTIEDFVAGLARDPELAKQPGDKPQAFLHDRTLLPRQRHLP